METDLFYKIFETNDIVLMNKYINRDNINDYFQGKLDETEKVTLLQMAMGVNSVVGVEYLLRRGADPNKNCVIYVDKDGKTIHSRFGSPLIHATLTGKFATTFAKMLIEYGADKHVHVNGWTAYNYAKMYKNEELMELLKE